MNSNFELCDIVNNASTNAITDNYQTDDLFAINQTCLLNSCLPDSLTDNSILNKDLSNFESAVENASMFNPDDLLTTDAAIDQLLDQATNDQDLYYNEPKRKRLS